MLSVMQAPPAPKDEEKTTGAGNARGEGDRASSFEHFKQKGRLLRRPFETQ
jgi:hypothetical protein